MNKRILKGFLLGALVLLLALPALAQGGPGLRGPRGGGPGPGPQGGEPPLERALERLDLSEEQRVEIEALIDDSRESSRDKAEQLRELRGEMKQLLAADDVDEDAFRQVAMQAAELDADLALERSRTMKQVKAQLTPEQLEQLGEMRQRRGEMRRGQRGGRGPAAGRRHRGGKREFDE